MSDYSAHAVDYYSSESVSNIFEPDVVLPSQFFATDCPGIAGGERKLMAALLSDGIEAYIHGAMSGRLERSDAREWIETKDHGYVFSFDVVCECLGIDADYLRLGLARYVDAARRSRELGIAPTTPWKKIRRPRK